MRKGDSGYGYYTCHTDERFRQYVLDDFCNQRDYIQESDIQEVTSLQITSQDVRSLSGIEYFRDLEELDCGNNQITYVDLGRNDKLRILHWFWQMWNFRTVRFSGSGMTRVIHQQAECTSMQSSMRTYNCRSS